AGLFGRLHGQSNPVSVNHFTGTANVSIPLYELKSGGVSMPIALSYSATGIKVKDSEGNAGMGWQVNIEGSVSRIVRGLPDDCKKDDAGYTRLGWLYNANGTKIAAFTPANDKSYSTCNDETADVNFINTNFTGYSDTEPDLFVVDAPGLSCQLVFDANHIIRTIPYADLKTEYTTDPVSGLITSFTITTDKGLKYVFSDCESTKRTYTGQFWLLRNEYEQYRYGVSFSHSWKLSRITDPGGNGLSFGYRSFGGIHLDEENPQYNKNIFSSRSNYAGYTINEISDRKRLDTVSRIHSGARRPVLTAGYVKDDNDILAGLTGSGKSYLFEYMGNVSVPPPATSSRYFLKTLYLDGQDRCEFEYNGEAVAALVDKYVPFPDNQSKGIDKWGYYNGANATNLVPSIYINPGENGWERYRFSQLPGPYKYSMPGGRGGPNASMVIMGSLSKILYKAGGYTELTYEQNDYYDDLAMGKSLGPGIRIKQITTSDGISTANNIIKTYTYTNPSTSLTSGKIVSVPVYAFTTDYVSDPLDGETISQIWKNSTYVSDEDLSQDDHSVIYSHVQESQSGAGSTLYQFSVPATNWDNSAPDWVPSMSYAARSYCDADPAKMRSDKDGYPFSPKTNYDFERGLLQKTSMYNDAGQLVSEQSYTYQRTGPPVPVWALKAENYGEIKFYSRYPVLTGCSELLTREEKKIYDSATLSQSGQITTDYFYSSPYHKQLTMQQVSSGEGSVYRTYTKYTRDYGPVSGSDASSIALQNLQAANVNVPAEIYSQTERNGTVVTTGAELTLFKAYTPGGATLYLPSQKLTLSAAGGLSNFQPSTVSGGTLNKDARYKVSENILAYDSYGTTLSTDNNKMKVQTSLTDRATLLKIADVSGARYDEVLFNDFDSELNGLSFAKEDQAYSYSADSRSGKQVLSLPASQALSQTLSRNPWSKEYIFSIWLKSSSAGALSLSLTGNSGQTFPYTLAYQGSSTWKYYELKVPVNQLSATFKARFYTSTAVLADDIWFYPGSAEVSSASYDPENRLRTSETNTNGVSAYYSFDARNRLLTVRDQDRQIVRRNTYFKKDAQQQLGPPRFSLTAGFNPVRLRPLSFTIDSNSYYYPYNEGLSYVWDFGDGSAPVTTTSLVSPLHTYSQAATYNLSLKAISPVFGEASNIWHFTISPLTCVVGYNSQTTNGKIKMVEFYQNGVKKYAFSESDLKNTACSVPEGIYTVKVDQWILDFEQAYATYQIGSGPQQDIPLGANPATLTLDLTGQTSLKFRVNQVQ
ncbi:PKD domain-containing protein, partial [Pararcticibacter amylolyticus]